MASVAITLDVDEVIQYLDTFRGLDHVVEAGLVATGPAAAYAEVWEWGNARQEKQGPRTVLGVNPDGDEVWLSTQAPMGYIAIHVDLYMQIVMAELANMAMSGGEGTVEELKAVAKTAMEQIKTVVSEHAPVDSGQLRDCFQVIGDDDSSLDDDPGGTVESRFNRVLNI